MKTVNIRDLRLRWPETERALQFENEILVTRDGQPVAKLVRLTEPQPRRIHWDAEKHRRRITKILGDKLFPSVDEPLAADRADRKL